MAKRSFAMAKPVLLAVACATLGTALPSVAQPVGPAWRPGDTWNRDAFWRGAPADIRERVDWLQQRINRGVDDGTMDPREADRAQHELDGIRRDAVTLEQRLDDTSRNISWARRNGAYYGGAQRDPYATDYDASRYYRDDPRYTERRLGPDDQVYRGSDGRYYCRRNDGTTGLIIGGVGGALAGNVLDGGRHRTAGTLIGGALGALLGKSVDQNNSDVRCR